MTRLRSKPKPCCGRTLCNCGKPPSLKRTPLQRGKPLERSGRINAVSAKRRRDNSKRRQMREQHFGKGQDRPACAVRWDAGCTRFADALHEIKKRSRGGSIVDADNCIPSCHYCNSQIEDHPEEAHRRGLAKHSWED